MESVSTDNSYAIPIVSVDTSNITFIAPLSNRLLSLNSSSFLVSENDTFLTITFKKIYVETSVRAESIGNLSNSQENNPDFNYIGFYRDAEIFYELAKFGYNQTIDFSLYSSPNMDETIHEKWIMASNSNSSVLVFIDKDMPSSDSTSIYSNNSEFINETTFLIDQTKSLTIVGSSDANVTAPFTIYNSTNGQ
jgi:hypothetical protein